MEKTNFIDARDIGEVAALVLSETGHRDRAYELTGAESYSYNKVAQMLTDELKRPIHYARPGFIRYMVYSLRQGMPFSFALVTGIIYTVARLGKADNYSPELATLLNRPARTLKTFIQEHRKHWIAP